MNPKEISYRLRRGTADMFRSLEDKNYRLFFIGQVVSLTGSWMENLAMGLLVYSLTGSAAALGTVAALTQAPTIFLAYRGGKLSDRQSPKRILITTQICSCLLATYLFLLVSNGFATLSWIYLIALLMGIAQAIDVPARQVLLPSLVRRDENLANAVVLNSTLFNLSRLVGPLLAVATISAVGMAGCFGINAFSFLFSIGTLIAIRPRGREKTEKTSSSDTIGTTITVIKRSPILSSLMLMAAVTGLFTFQYLVLLPAFAAEQLFSGFDPTTLTACSKTVSVSQSIVCQEYTGTLGLLTACSAAGALLGSLLAARYSGRKYLRRGVGYTGYAAGVGLLLLSMSTQIYQAAIAITLLGIALTACLVSNQALRQVEVNNSYRGKILSLFIVATLGLMAVGNLAMGKLTAISSVGLVYQLCGVSTLVGSYLYFKQLRTGSKDKPK